MKKLLLTLFIFHFSFFFLNAQGSWSPRASLPDSSRACGIGFSIGNYGYVGLGIHNGHVNYPCLDDFWQFDPSTNSWTQKANFPGKARICPATFVIGHYAYVVTGQINDSSPPGYTFECWRYDANNDTWTQKVNFPGTSRAYAVGFAIGSKGYVGTGSQYDFNFRKDFWVYDTATNAWTQIADLPPPTARFSASGFAVNGKGYICFGYDSDRGPQNDMWEYDTGTNLWIQKASSSAHS